MKCYKLQYDGYHIKRCNFENSSGDMVICEFTCDFADALFIIVWYTYRKVGSDTLEWSYYEFYDWDVVRCKFPDLPDDLDPYMMYDTDQTVILM